MDPQAFHRRLTAILSADVAGYSRLMQDDEAATVKILEAYKQIFSDLIKQHRGRVVDSPGDNLLAEFASVVDAVQCAVAVQKELQARNAELPENRRMLFRIGVNLGDVIEESDRIYGDGVNIAARLESLADPGGICISKTAFDQIETKLPFGYEFLGEKTVKNIAKPVGAYRVILEPRVIKKRRTGLKIQGKGWRLAFYGLLGLVVVTAAAAVWQLVQRPALPPAEKADPQKMAFPLPDKPSIVVLPFVNMSDDPKQEFFSDGITDEIITALSKSSQIFVIARSSSFTYKGKPVSVKHVSETMGVRYVLEGSVRRDGDRVRITTQLVDAVTGHHLWTERYDRDLKDIFSLQDEITIEVCRQLRADASLPFMPIIMVTAKADSKDVVAGLEAGGDEYLTKPVDHAALVARVKSMLRIKDLHDTVCVQAARLEEQSTQLSEWNRTLKDKVAEQIAELERVGRLKRFLSPQLAEIIVASGEEKVLESHRREVTVVFLDLRGFTSFSDVAEPEEVIGFLRDYHAEMGRLVFQFKGTLEHFAGDGIMVFFNDPFPTEDHTQKAVCMAIEMQARVRELRPGWLKKGYDLHLGVGLAAGYATIGTIGFEGRRDYAAVGKVTILASRLSSEANGGQILTDQKTFSKAEHLVEAEPLGELQLKGFGRPTAVFNIIGHKL